VTRIRLRYVKQYRDQTGVLRRYFRRGRAKQIPLPGEPGSREFMEAYQAALAERSEPAVQPIGAHRTEPGTMAALIADYYGSAEYKNLAPITRSTYRNEIEKLRLRHGGKRITKLTREHVKKLLAEKADAPGAANKLLRTLKMLMRFAMAMDPPMRRDDPTSGIKKLRIPGDGFRAWEEADIATFEAVHPIGSRARLALALLLFTAQRRSDVIRMGRQHIRDGLITVKQQKTGAALWIPLHRELQTILDASRADNLTFLVTIAGKPFSAAGFGNWFGDCCREAGLSVGFNAHGLRKAAARRLAEAGCTSKQIMAITGHRSLSEVERYVLAAEQVVLARQAMDRLGSNSEHRVSNAPALLDKSAKKR
jgi:integrase